MVSVSRFGAVICTYPSPSLLKPNTMYFVYAVTSSICRGRYFYPPGEFQGIQFGIIHTFLLGRLLSPDQVTNSRPLFSRIVIYLYDLLVLNQMAQDGKSCSVTSNFQG